MNMKAEASTTQSPTSNTANRYDVVIFDFDGTLADSGPWFRSVMIPKRSSGIGQDYFPVAKTGPMQVEG